MKFNFTCLLLLFDEYSILKLHMWLIFVSYITLLLACTGLDLERS